MDDLEFDSNLSDKAVYDCNLIRAALDNADQKAYAELMGRYRDSVYFMLLKMVNNKDDADDLTIEHLEKHSNVYNNTLLITHSVHGYLKLHLTMQLILSAEKK